MAGNPVPLFALSFSSNGKKEVFATPPFPVYFQSSAIENPYKNLSI